MRKFSKITESKQFLGWSKERLLNEFSQLNPTLISIDTMYVYKEGDVSECVQHIGDIEKYHLQDKIFAPMFFVYVSLGIIPEQSNSHESDNWAHESVKFDLIKDEFLKLTSFLDRFREDFYISIETGRGESDTNCFLSYDKKTKHSALLSVSLSLIMKDYFEYEEIR